MKFYVGKYQVILVTSRAMLHGTPSWHPPPPPVPFLAALFSLAFLTIEPVPLPSWSQWQTLCWLWGWRVHCLMKWEHTQGITQRVTEPSWLGPPQDAVLLENTEECWVHSSVLLEFHKHQSYLNSLPFYFIFFLLWKENYCWRCCKQEEDKLFDATNGTKLGVMKEWVCFRSAWVQAVRSK